jgi:hypothetical protein
MQRRQGGGHVSQQPADLLGRQALAGLDQLLEVLALEQIHGVVGAALVHTVVEGADDPRMTQRGEGVELALETEQGPVGAPAPLLLVDHAF